MESTSFHHQNFNNGLNYSSRADDPPRLNISKRQDNSSILPKVNYYRIGSLNTSDFVNMQHNQHQHDPNTILTTLITTKQQLLILFDHIQPPISEEQHEQQLLSIQSTLLQSIHQQTELIYSIKEDNLTLHSQKRRKLGPNSNLKGSQSNKTTLQCQKEQFEFAMEKEKAALQPQRDQFDLDQEHFEFQQQQREQLEQNATHLLFQS